MSPDHNRQRVYNHRDEPHHGILIIRLKRPSRQKIHRYVLQALKRYTPKEWPALWWSCAIPSKALGSLMLKNSKRQEYITAYLPDKQDWEENFKTRKKS
ncbi:MAG: hypothetical protein KKE44_02335 [Proteobacteria bacterium]|nr:hypothetical protein [Pseudomonadota bacterium]